MDSNSSPNDAPFRGKASWKVTNRESGRSFYTRDRKIIVDITLYPDTHYIFDFVSNTPPAAEVLYFANTESE